MMELFRIVMRFLKLPLNFGSSFLRTDNNLFRRNLTQFLSVGPNAFGSRRPQTDVVIRTVARFEAQEDGVILSASLPLPDGATILSCVVYGNTAAAAETWQLRRQSLTSTSSILLATANINTADKSIDSPLVDTEKFHYTVATGSIDFEDEIYSCQVEYIFLEGDR